MTLEEFQNKLHVAYQGDIDYPTEGEDEWTRNLDLLEYAINAWETENGMLWAELWVQNADGDGDKLVTSNELDYDCASDFRFPGGFVKTRTGASGQATFWKVTTPHAAELLDGTSGNFCYFTGNKKVGFTLHFMSQPTVGDIIDYPYYKDAFVPSETTDVIEMSDPFFAVEVALSKITEVDGDGDRSNLALAKAEGKLNSMKNKNVLPIWFQDNKVPDSDYSVGQGGFGT